MDGRRARGERTRQRMLDVALALFAEHGYEATTVEMITTAAEVSERTFFHHFPSKEDILFDGYADRLGEAARRFRAALREGGDLHDALAAVSSAVVDAIGAQPTLFLQRARLYAIEDGPRATMLRINEAWIDEMAVEVGAHLGLDPDTDVRPRLAASAVNSANRTAIDIWAASGGTASLAAAASQALDLLRPALDRIEASATTPLPRSS